MSHELRTPLNAIVGWTELLLKDTLSPERRTHAMKVIQRNARAQTVLVEDLLDISRIMAGKLRLTLAPANMATIVQNSLDALAPAAAAKRLDIEPSIGVEIPPIVAVGQIGATHKGSRGIYGSPRVHRELKAKGLKVGKKRRAFDEPEGLRGRCKRRFVRTTDSKHEHPLAPNVLDRDFETEAPDRACVGDVGRRGPLGASGPAAPAPRGTSLTGARGKGVARAPAGNLVWCSPFGISVAANGSPLRRVGWALGEVMSETGETERPLRDLGLSIRGSSLEPLIASVAREMEALGFALLRPRFYLTTEWGVAFGTVAVGIPFYLASSELLRLQEEREGHVEGTDPEDIQRYLRHELGHVVNYAYRLHERPEWKQLFGNMERPYLDDYRALPFDTRFVRHLPGWYAQKHPDEDWAETFGVLLGNPASVWRTQYSSWPGALAKLEGGARLVATLAGTAPLVQDPSLDEALETLPHTLEEHYTSRFLSEKVPAGLDASLASLFDGWDMSRECSPLAQLIAEEERELIASLYRWCAHFPERSRLLLRHLALRAHRLGLAYPCAERSRAVLVLATFMCTLAMNHVHRGTYLGPFDAEPTRDPSGG